METFLLNTVEEVLHMQGSSSSSRWTADDRIRIVMESLTILNHFTRHSRKSTSGLSFFGLRLSDISLHFHIAIDAIMFFRHHIWSPFTLYIVDDECHE